MKHVREIKRNSNCKRNHYEVLNGNFSLWIPGWINIGKFCFCHADFFLQIRATLLAKYCALLWKWVENWQGYVKHFVGFWDWQEYCKCSTSTKIDNVPVSWNRLRFSNLALDQRRVTNQVQRGQKAICLSSLSTCIRRGDSSTKICFWNKNA